MKKPKIPLPTAPQNRMPGHDDIVHVFGDLLDWKIAAIIKTRATTEELEAAAAWAAGESDIMGRERKRLSGRVAEVCDILTAEEEPEEERRA